MNKIIYILLLILILTFLPEFTETVMALPPPPPPPEDIPIDGGLGILLIAGIGYGAKKLYSERKENIS